MLYLKPNTPLSVILAALGDLPLSVSGSCPGWVHVGAVASYHQASGRVIPADYPTAARLIIGAMASCKEQPGS